MFLRNLTPILSEFQECDPARNLDVPNPHGCCSGTCSKKLAAGPSLVHPRQTHSSRSSGQRWAAMEFRPLFAPCLCIWCAALVSPCQRSVFVQTQVGPTTTLWVSVTGPWLRPWRKLEGSAKNKCCVAGFRWAVCHRASCQQSSTLESK